MSGTLGIIYTLHDRCALTPSKGFYEFTVNVLLYRRICSFSQPDIFPSLPPATGYIFSSLLPCGYFPTSFSHEPPPHLPNGSDPLTPLITVEHACGYFYFVQFTLTTADDWQTLKFQQPVVNVKWAKVTVLSRADPSSTASVGFVEIMFLAKYKGKTNSLLHYSLLIKSMLL